MSLLLTEDLHVNFISFIIFLFYIVFQHSDFLENTPNNEDFSEKAKKKYNLINDETRKKVVEMVEIKNASLKEVIFLLNFFFKIDYLKGFKSIWHQTVNMQSDFTSLSERRQVREEKEKNKKRQQCAREDISSGF